MGRTSIDNDTRKTRTVAPKITLAMLLCGIVWAAAVGVASAGTMQDAAAITIKYDRAALESDRGAKLLYNRLADAAAEIYPSSNPRLVPSEVRQWRQQSIARAVMTIDSPKLAAVYNSSVRNN